MPRFRAMCSLLTACALALGISFLAASNLDGAFSVVPAYAQNGDASADSPPSDPGTVTPPSDPAPGNSNGTSDSNGSDPGPQNPVTDPPPVEPPVPDPNPQPPVQPPVQEPPVQDPPAYDPNRVGSQNQPLNNVSTGIDPVSGLRVHLPTGYLIENGTNRLLIPGSLADSGFVLNPETGEAEEATAQDTATQEIASAPAVPSSTPTMSGPAPTASPSAQAATAKGNSDGSDWWLRTGVIVLLVAIAAYYYARMKGKSPFGVKAQAVE